MVNKSKAAFALIFVGALLVIIFSALIALGNFSGIDTFETAMLVVGVIAILDSFVLLTTNKHWIKGASVVAIASGLFGIIYALFFSSGWLNVSTISVVLMMLGSLLVVVGGAKGLSYKENK